MKSTWATNLHRYHDARRQQARQGYVLRESMADFVKREAAERAALAKGDAAGHEFHGNQYGAAAAAAHDIARRALNENRAGLHRAAAAAHRVAAEHARDAGSAERAAYHETSASVHQAAALKLDSPSHRTSPAVFRAEVRGELNKLRKIHKPSKRRHGSKVQVVDDDGHVYGEHDTEAEADRQLAALYAAKDREAKKGDAPGHEFHGNQHTGGGGGERGYAEAKASAEAHSSRARDAENRHELAGRGDKARTAREAAQAHRDAAGKHAEAWSKAPNSERWVHERVGAYHEREAARYDKKGGG